MRKHKGIRVLGVLALLAWAATAVLGRATVLAADTMTRANVTLLAIIALAVAGLLTVLWLILSVIDWTVRRSGEMRRATDAEAFAQAYQYPNPRLNNAAPLQPPAIMPGCVLCGRPAAVIGCDVHRVALCATCITAHLSALGPDCHLVPLASGVNPPRPPR